MSANFQRSAGILPAESGPARGQDARAPFLHPLAEIETHRHHLPHWQQGNVFYFVTFRLADSLPASLVRSHILERETWLRTHPKPWSENTEQEYHEIFSRRIEDHLDNGAGDCILRQKPAALIVSEALAHFDGVKYELEAYAIMPNHVHVLFQLCEGFKLPEIIHSWKSFTSKRLNALLGKSGPLWMEDYWDRIIRNPLHLHLTREYIRENPAKACIPIHERHSFQRSTGILPAESGTARGQDARAPLKIASLLAALACLALSGCDWMPGKPNEKIDKWRPESDVTDFHELYTQNCIACHSDGANPAGSISLNDPLYLSIIPEATLHDVIANGIKDTRMPAFSQVHGGMLTDPQIDILVKGILAWGNNTPAPTGAPPYAAPLGNAAAGAAAFAVSCASCHGADGKGLAGKAGSVINPAYLGLVSDQYLRTITIAGRNDLGCPDYQHRVPGRAMTNEEISDVTAWLVAQRKNEFGHPLVPATPPAQP